MAVAARRALAALAVCLPGALASPATRRSMLRRAGAFVMLPPAAHASWLTSQPLEQLRKLEQEAADAKYGELAPIDDGRGGAQRLVPIVQLKARLERLSTDAREPSKWPSVRADLAAPQLRTQQLKRDFNLYSDNIYYQDEARANVYLLGGTTPQSSQTEQYLLRNEVIGAVQNAARELEYLEQQAALPAGDTDSADLLGYFATARSALDEYLTRAEARDLAGAQRLVAGGGNAG